MTGGPKNRANKQRELITLDRRHTCNNGHNNREKPESPMVRLRTYMSPALYIPQSPRGFSMCPRLYVSLTLTIPLILTNPNFATPFQLISAPWPIGSSWGLEGRFSRDLLPVFSAGGHFEQFWHGQGCPLFDADHPAFPLQTTTSNPNLTLTLTHRDLNIQGRGHIGTTPCHLVCEYIQGIKTPPEVHCQVFAIMQLHSMFHFLLLLFIHFFIL